jgi:hypothetical protein
MPTPFDILHAEYTPYITRLARRFAKGDRETANDLAQEAWLALLLIPEARWTQPRYVRTVAFRAMSRWLSQEAAQRLIVPPGHPEHKTQQQYNHLQLRKIRLRRNVPRQQLSRDKTLAHPIPPENPSETQNAVPSPKHGKHRHPNRGLTSPPRRRHQKEKRT